MSAWSIPLYNPNTTNARQLATANRQQIANQGNALGNQFYGYGEENQGGTNPNTVASTADYLNPIESNMAEGNGGYNSSLTGQIEYSPQDVTNLETGAGIAAGAQTAASVGAAQRAANASGGNPLALAAYEDRAAQQEGQQAGEAATQAAATGKQLQSSGAQTVGNAQLAQQDQSLNYYQQQNAQANQDVQQANQLQSGIYGTETGGENSAAGIGLQASQTPSTFDEIMGALAGAAPGIGTALSHLADGDILPSAGTPAVIAEDGPEKVVRIPNKNEHVLGNQNPARRRYTGTTKAAHMLYMDDGGFGDPDASSIPTLNVPHTPDYNATIGNPNNSVTVASGGNGTPSQPWWKRVASVMSTPNGGNNGYAGARGGSSQQSWTRVTPYSQLGQLAGNVVSSYLADGDVSPADYLDGPLDPMPGYMPDAPGLPDKNGANGIFTKPTRVNLEPREAVVPLKYRATAKLRPHMAALPAAPQRKVYRASA